MLSNETAQRLLRCKSRSPWLFWSAAVLAVVGLIAIYFVVSYGLAKVALSLF